VSYSFSVVYKRTLIKLLLLLLLLSLLLFIINKIIRINFYSRKIKIFHILYKLRRNLSPLPNSRSAVVVDAAQWISGKGEDSGVPSTRNANLIGSWILSSARNYYLRYKSGDLPRLPSSQRASLVGPAVIIRMHTFSWLSRTRSAAGSHIDSLRPRSSVHLHATLARLPPSVNY